MDIVYHLVHGLADSSPQETRLARFFLENFFQLPDTSMEQLAARAGVSQATLQQFARTIGCSDMNDFLGQVRHQRDDSRVQQALAVPSQVLGDAAWVDNETLEYLANRGGVAKDVLERFSHSIGRDTDGDIITRIRQRLAEFSQQESRVAQAILDDPGFAASATIDQLAQAAGVSPATITRFARAAGCDDIRDLRMKLAQASTALPGSGLSSRWQQRLNGIQQTLNQQLETLQEAAVARAIALLKRASAVHIFSAGAADTPFASLLQYRLLTQGLPASVCSDPALMSFTASMLNSGQAMIVLASSGPDGALLAAVQQARKQGAEVIMVTSDPGATAHAKDILLSPGDGRYGSLLIIDLLCDGVAAGPEASGGSEF
ncbi:MurR/RpiR family transcriptional regulator [Cedecea davisae]|uniref:MurR/RpiR family transcriptional regulator n=1 Tax=Cedecea davisae TaxID=158484 RepID=UPI001D0B6EFF|nr:MurR/RpiR family transcriptional regulator [Cedecea davisae]